MSKKLFTEEEIIILKQNKYVKKVTQKVLLIQMNLKEYL